LCPLRPKIGLALLTGSCYHAGMNRRQNGGNIEGSSGWVNTDVAAEALGVSARSVRNYILSGDLVARKETEGINERYRVSIDSVYALRDRRNQQGKLRGNSRRSSRRSESSSEDTTEQVRETAVDMLRETIASLETHIAQNAELRARLELTERAESTLREELERERRQHQEDVQRERAERLESQERAERLEQERARLEAEHRRAEEEAATLREQLETERGKGFWRKLFGG
jgi:colicin import membrane protein